MTGTSDRQYIKVAVKAALAGGEVLRRYYNKNIEVGYKSRIDPVSTADRKSQEAVFGVIKKYFPEHAVIGEEDKEHAACGQYCWIVDPLDGTVNYIHGVKIFAVSIGLSYNGCIIAGVVYAPLLDEMFTATLGGGAFLNGKLIKASRVNTLVRGLVVTGFPYDVRLKRNEVLKTLAKVLPEAQGVRRLGSAALDLCYVACGRFDSFWEHDLKPWDVAAGSLIVTEAGGKVTDFNGKGNYIWGGQLLATNKYLHDKMRALILP